MFALSRIHPVVASTLCLAGLLLSTAAWADTIEVLRRRLEGHSDFRVRTQAALALGATGDKRAVEPLCTGLDDPNTTVRAAAAAALGKLRRGGVECLKARLEEEANASVKSVIVKALGRVEGGGATGITSETRYYLVLGPTTDQTGRAKGEIDQVVRRAILTALDKAEGYGLAADGETKAQSAAVLKQHSQLVAYFLWPKVRAPEYSGSNLTIRFEISVFTYPGKALKGTLQRKLTMQDVESRDPESEDQLVEIAVEKSFEELSKNITRFE